MAELESLNLKIKAESSSATSQLNKLSKSLEALKTASSSMSRGGKIAVTALNGIKSAASLSGKALKGVGSAVKNAMPSFKGLNTSLGELKLGFIAFIAVARKLVQSLSSCVKQSMDFVETMNLFNVSMGDNAIAAGEFAEKVQQAMGIDMAEWMRNQGVFQTLIEGFGVASEKADIMSQQLTQLGYDLSSLFNMPFAESMQKLQSGIAGELEPLRRLGFDLSQAKLQQIAYDHGIQQTVQTMTQAQKSQLRYYAIMTQVTTAHGDMARTIMQPANMLRVLRQNVTIAARSIGNLLIPVVQKLAAVAIIVARGIAKVANAIAVLFGIDTNGWRDFVDDLNYSGDTFDDVGDGIDDVGSSTGKATKKIKEFKKQFLGFDKINNITLPDPYNSTGGKSGGGGSIGGGDWDLPLPTYDFLQGITDAFAEVHPTLQKLFDDLSADMEAGGHNIGTILGTALRDGLNSIKWQNIQINGKKIAENIADTINDFLEVPGLFTSVGKTVGNALNTVFTVANTWANAFHWDSLGKAIADGINGFFGTYKMSLVATTFSNIATGILSTLATAVGETSFTGIAINISNGLNAIKWNDIKAGAEKLTANIASGINSLLGSTSLFEGAGSTVANVLNTIFTTAKTWANKFSWEKLGKAISTSVNKFFKDFDFALAADAISNWATGLLKSAKEAVKNVNWTSVGASIREFITNLDIAGVISGTLELGLELIGAAKEIIPELMKGLLQATLKLAVELVKKGWNTLREWVLGYNKDENVEQKVSLGKDFGGAANVHDWVNSPNQKGSGNVTQKVGLGKDFGGYKTVGGWASDSKQVGTAKPKVPVGLNKGWDTKDGESISGYAKNKWQGKTKAHIDVGVTKGWNEKDGKTIRGYAKTNWQGKAQAHIGVGVSKGWDTTKGSTITEYSKKKWAGSGVVKLKVDIDESSIKNFNSNWKMTLTPTPKAMGGIFKNGKWKPVTAAANGGAFNTGQMFIAREAGPELVGRIGRSTAVMNNDQIVSSVAAGVASANSTQNSLLRQLISAVQSGGREFALYVDGVKFGQVAVNSINTVQRQAGRTLIKV